MEASALDLTKARTALAHAQEQYHQIDLMVTDGKATDDDAVIAFMRMLDASRQVKWLEKLEQEGNLL